MSSRRAVNPANPGGQTFTRLFLHVTTTFCKENHIDNKYINYVNNDIFSFNSEPEDWNSVNNLIDPHPFLVDNA